MGRPPQPGEVLSQGLQDALKLTAKQKQQVEKVQADVNAKLDKILTAEQKGQIRQMQMRGPGRPPGGGPDGPPPGGPGGDGPPPPGNPW